MYLLYVTCGRGSPTVKPGADEDHQEKCLSQLYDHMPEGLTPLATLKNVQQRQQLGGYLPRLPSLPHLQSRTEGALSSCSMYWIDLVSGRSSWLISLLFEPGFSTTHLCLCLMFSHFRQLCRLLSVSRAHSGTQVLLLSFSILI